jgi:hypothetical protein
MVHARDDAEIGFAIAAMLERVRAACRERRRGRARHRCDGTGSAHDRWSTDDDASKMLSVAGLTLRSRS